MQTAKKNIQKRILSFAMLLAVVFAMAQLSLVQSVQEASAGSLWDSQTGMGGGDSEIGEVFGEKTDTPEDIRIIIAEIIKVFLGIIGITLVILLIWAGYKWMTAGGNEENIKEAQKQITRAIIGLLIVLMAWGVAEFTTGCLADVTGASNAKWYCP